VILVAFLTFSSVTIVDLQKNNQSLMEKINQQQNEMKEQMQQIKIENQDLIKKNQGLEQENQKIIEAFNKIQEDLSSESQSGEKPSRSGITPQFILVNRGSFNRAFQKNLLNDLSEGSYQNEKVEIPIDVDDINLFQSLGSWKITNYTACIEECDADPFTTASGQIVTPGFTVAVDPKYWPYGTIFYFKDVGFGIAADCGGSVKGRNRADYLTASKKSNIPNQTEVYLVYQPETK